MVLLMIRNSKGVCVRRERPQGSLNKTSKLERWQVAILRSALAILQQGCILVSRHMSVREGSLPHRSVIQSPPHT